MKVVRTIDRLEVALIELEYAKADLLHDGPREERSDDVSGPPADNLGANCVRLALRMAIDVLRSIDGGASAPERRDAPATTRPAPV